METGGRNLPLHCPPTYIDQVPQHGLNCWRGPGVTPAQRSSPFGIGITRLPPASSWILTVAITARLCAGLRPWKGFHFQRRRAAPPYTTIGG